MADPREAPGADEALADEALEERAYMRDEGLVERHARSGVGPALDEAPVRHDVRMQEEEVEPGELEAFQARLDRLPHYPLDLARGRLAEIAFAGDADARRQLPAKGGADDLLGLAVAIARRQVQERDAALGRLAHRRDAFLEGGPAPQHAEPAAAERQPRDRRQGPEGVLLHGSPPMIRRQFRAPIDRAAVVRAGASR